MSASSELKFDGLCGGGLGLRERERERERERVVLREMSFVLREMSFGPFGLGL